MRKIILAKGTKFNRLTFVRHVGVVNGNSKGEFICECGSFRINALTVVIKGNIKSCGCLRKIGGNKKHGFSNDRFYKIYNGIKTRCANKAGHAYCRYGGRGIKNEWITFDMFKKDMHGLYLKHVEKYGVEDTTIDRIDPNKNYNKQNCRWVTREEQCDNKRNTIWITYNGITKTLTKWAKENNLNRDTIYARYLRGLSAERVLSTGDLRSIN
jgi:hypothetical protein